MLPTVRATKVLDSGAGDVAEPALLHVALAKIHLRRRPIGFLVRILIILTSCNEKTITTNAYFFFSFFFFNF